MWLLIVEVLVELIFEIYSTSLMAGGAEAGGGVLFLFLLNHLTTLLNKSFLVFFNFYFFFSSFIFLAFLRFIFRLLAKFSSCFEYFLCNFCRPNFLKVLFVLDSKILATWAFKLTTLLSVKSLSDPARRSEKSLFSWPFNSLNFSWDRLVKTYSYFSSTGSIYFLNWKPFFLTTDKTKLYKKSIWESLPSQ